ncbi:tetratricopeptide repeat protein (plasmid) [Bradyrhizobium sp. 62B]|uniref:tetratricopeptide repeat protein n=1 Tax=Bradyrhizobium sp. 62B TaxID=2898442 RepID=UPI002557E3F6|nr:tetratricopeptide repeat protein [Bradyrhizobium sp. 62B]
MAVATAVAAYLHQLGDLNSSLIMLEQITAGCEALLAPNDPLQMDPFKEYADRLADEGHFGEAEAICRELIKIHFAASGKIDHNIASSFLQVGSMLTNKGEHEEARLVLRQALEFYESEQSTSGAVL